MIALALTVGCWTAASGLWFAVAMKRDLKLRGMIQDGGNDARARALLLGWLLGAPSLALWLFLVLQTIARQVAGAIWRRRLNRSVEKGQIRVILRD